MAASKKPICTAAILRILIKPDPPTSTGASVAHPVLRAILHVSCAVSVHYNRRPRNPSGPVLARRSSTLDLERKDRSEFGSVILPFVGWLSSNGVYGRMVQTTGGVDRLLESELAPVVEFVVHGSNRCLPHQKWQRGSAGAVVGKRQQSQDYSGRDHSPGPCPW